VGGAAGECVVKADFGHRGLRLECRQRFRVFPGEHSLCAMAGYGGLGKIRSGLMNTTASLELA
jgi:hypothetical protein